jgi:hypothetical protein
MSMSTELIPEMKQTDVSFIEEAKAQGVMAYVVVPPLVCTYRAHAHASSFALF